MKILILNWRDIKNPKAGGSEIYFHELGKRWAEQGNKVTWISGGWDKCPKEEIIDNIAVRRVGRDISLYLLVALEYSKLKEKPDVIIDVENGLPFFSPLFSRKKKILHIHHYHKDVWSKEASGKGIKDKIISKIGYILETRLMPLVYKNTKVITLAKSSGEEIKQELKLEVIGEVSPGIKFYDTKKLAKNKKPAILFLNRIKKYKGIDTFLKAAKELAQDVEFWVVGDGDYLVQAKEYVKNNKLNATFFGKVSEEKKVELMKKAWVFVNPSFKEGWGIVNIEASYFGLPVIGSNVSGIKDSVVDGKTGLLFEYGDHVELKDKILKLVGDSRLRKKLGDNGRKFARGFDWDVKSKEYLDIIKKL